MTDDLHQRATALDDRALVDAYEATDDTPGDPWVEALIAEMERRNVDF